MALTQVDQGLLGTNAQYTGFKNRIINGSMVIDQRNAGASVTIPTGTSTYALDRWQVNKDTAGVVLTVGQGSGSNPAQFPNAQVFTASTGASVGAADYLLFMQKVEGFNTVDLAFGTASAATVTLSFWVRSSITGTYSAYLQNSAGSRAYVATYTVSSANTWEQKSITIAGDTTGTWIGSTNGIGLRVGFDLGSGSNYSTTAGAWTAGNYTRTSGTVNWGATTGATFYITGVQLEKGSTATSFDYRPYGTELMLCQRYYEKGYPQGTAPANNAATDIRQGLATVYGTTVAEVNQIRFEVTKRTVPTATLYCSSSTSASAGQWSLYNPAVGWVGYAVSAGTSDSALGVTATVSSLTTGSSYITSGGWAVSAEL
jgi:hypothetical protein